MKNYLWIIRYVKPYWKYASLNISFNLLSTFFNLFSLAMIKPFLDLLFGQEKLIHIKPDFSFSAKGIEEIFKYQLSQIIELHGKEKALVFLCLGVVVLFFFKNIFRYLGMYFVAPIRNGVSKDIRFDAYKKILDLPLSFFSEEKKGDLIARMTNDVQEIEWSILSSIEAIFRDPVAIITFLLTLFYISPELSIFVLIMLPLTGIIIGSIGRSLKKSSALGQEKLGNLLSVIEETLTGLRIVKAFTAESFISKRFTNVNKSYETISNKMYRRRDLAVPLTEFLSVLVLVVVMWFGGQLVFGTNSLEASSFIAFVVIFSQIIPPAKSFTAAYYNIQKGVASVDRIKLILDGVNNITEKENAIEKIDFKEEINYKNISFAYLKNEDGWVLRNINLKISKGKTIALVGQSGAGKTTLVDLLPRFYDPSEGSILIDGRPIQDFKISSLRKLLGVVTQESILFNETVFNNIAFGTDNASEEEVIAAAKIANAHEFIIELPNGYQTNIGDRGGKLSGGQRQRLSIARAVFKNPPILILDEATSALDTESERLVQDALYKLMKSRTSLVIAHRLSTIQFADEIIVMHRGEIIERGTHIELLENQGTYKKLYDLQSFV